MLNKKLKKKKYKVVVDNKMKYFGETDDKKRVIRINKKLSKTRTLSGGLVKNSRNPKYPGVLDTIVHEHMHATNPKLTEKQVYKRTKHKVMRLSPKQKGRFYAMADKKPKSVRSKGKHKSIIRNPSRSNSTRGFGEGVNVLI